MKITDEDIGLGKGVTASDERLKKAADEGRTSRSTEDRKFTQDRELTDRVRASSKRDEFRSNILPDPPEVPGFKLIWLSTTHNGDTIPERMRRGYEPVKLEDVPGYEAWQMKSGDWAGFIGVREMLLFKIPLKQWQEDMQYLHHTAPMDEEQGIKQDIMGMKNELEDGRSTVSISKGLQQLATPVRNPKWS